ncbi:MAG: riboflavin synthase [Desulfurococcales archaeon]|nr:riboflavin synthase [Desulfurococcales archaeon]
MKKCVGVVDTTFARVDMGEIAVRTIEENLSGYTILRHTVPGVKDLPGAAKRILDRGCEGVITLGWIGSREADKLSYLAASIGLILVEVLTGKIVIDVTVHEDEAPGDPEKLKAIAVDRTRKHAINLVRLLREGPQALVKYAGQGLRQGYPDAGPL